MPRQQGQGLKLFKAVASPQGQIYVLLADPSVKNADYSVALANRASDVEPCCGIHSHDIDREMESPT